MIDGNQAGRHSFDSVYFVRFPVVFLMKALLEPGIIIDSRLQFAKSTYAGGIVLLNLKKLFERVLFWVDIIHPNYVLYLLRFATPGGGAVTTFRIFALAEHPYGSTV